MLPLTKKEMRTRPVQRAPNEKEDTEDPFGLPEEEPTQVEYIEEENESSEISTEARHDSEVHKKKRK
jgi:hypothetical protein